MSRYAHYSACAVTHEYIVGDVDRHLLMCEGVDRILADEDAGLLVCGGSTLDLVHVVYSFDVIQNVLLIFGTLYVLKNCRIFRSQYHESGSVDSVYTCGEYGEHFIRILHLEVDFAAVGSSDPVLLHESYLLRPAVQLTVIEILKKSVSIVSDLEVPLAEVLLGDRCLASFTYAVNYLLVCKYSLT